MNLHWSIFKISGLTLLVPLFSHFQIIPTKEGNGLICIRTSKVWIFFETNKFIRVFTFGVRDTNFIVILKKYINPTIPHRLKKSIIFHIKPPGRTRDSLFHPQSQCSSSATFRTYDSMKKITCLLFRL